ncbi:chemotaxis protein MotB [Azomonas agilis]|uniref:Chemotaxis protein MotB n=1 Tax=Azomonas agilis TaxID=116849 RepID=A0A562I2N7_9GAMM|nr:flagellar motor protein MotD [Azomonas agilis]TWH64935.1 chemotaxis protein MotB [Azomonas agilis]
MPRHRRRSHPEEHENHERWLVSYADFITLLFAFFVVMYAMSSLNEGKYKVLTESLEGIFSEPVRSFRPIPIGEDRPSSLAPGVPGGSSSTPTDSLELIGQGVQQAFSDLVGTGQISLRGNEMWLEIELSSNLLFPSGGAIPNDNAFALIDKVAAILAPYQNAIRVEGFTDDQPIKSANYPTNWELSVSRAASIVRLLAMHGVDPQRLSAVGYGEYRPIADNATGTGRARNRRVVLAVARDTDVRRNMTTFTTGQVNAARLPRTL